MEATSVYFLLFSLFIGAKTQTNEDCLEYHVTEEKPINSYVGNLVKDFELYHKYSSNDLRFLRFSFLTHPNLDRQYFVIDEVTGVITNSFVVDREKICPRMEDCVVKFDVAIQPIKYFQIIKVKVEITDINDNPPVFPERSVFHQISELAELGTAFVVPAASDLDSGLNGIQVYELIPADGKFELSTRTTADGGTDLRLILKERLDRETEDHHLVTVLAVDGGDPSNTGSIMVNVSVLDANDNNPTFENTSYDFWVPENIAVGTVILKVKATDRDIGLNAAIVYEFSKHTLQEHGHLFGIQSQSGKVYLKNSLDYETGSIYLLSVTANDRGPDNLPAHASVIVRVEDVNDHSPQISVNTLTANSHAEVRENSDIGTFVAHLSVVDEDSGDNGRFLCAVDDQNFVLQPIYSSELKLVTAARLDREQRDGYDLSISCKDYGLQPQSSVVPLKVKVADDNDHTPQFQRDYYETTITENNEIGSTLFEVSAVDRDVGLNGEITFRIDKDLKRYFHLDQHNGIITSAISFDREDIDEIVFYLAARDAGDPARASNARMKLIILDEDDNRPAFVSDRFVFNVLENQLSWTEVGIVVAHDNDTFPFNAFVYSFEPDREISELFEVNPINGRIITKDSLDREKKSIHFLTVLAVTSSSSSSFPTSAYTATAGVTIRVHDVNDNSPVFTFPALGNETLYLSAHAPKGHTVVRLRAVDLDTGQNANLTYQLISTNKPNIFRVVAETGDVIVASDLSKITMETTLLRLSVRDGGQPVLSDHSQLRIIISKDIVFVESDNSSLSILASEDMVVVLSFTLAVILLAIAIIVTIICIFRRRTRTRRSRNGSGRSFIGSGCNGGKGGGGDEKKPVLICTVAQNGKLCNDGNNTMTTTTTAGNGKATAVVNAYTNQELLMDHCNCLPSSTDVNSKEDSKELCVKDDLDLPASSSSSPYVASAASSSSSAAAAGGADGGILSVGTSVLTPQYSSSSHNFSSSSNWISETKNDAPSSSSSFACNNRMNNQTRNQRNNWKQLSYQELCEPKKPVVVFIRDQRDIERETERDNDDTETYIKSSQPVYYDRPMMTGDVLSLGGGGGNGSCYHTLPLRLTEHQQQQRRAITQASNQPSISTEKIIRDRSHHRPAVSRLNPSGHPRSTAAALPIEGLRGPSPSTRSATSTLPTEGGRLVGGAGGAVGRADQTKTSLCGWSVGGVDGGGGERYFGGGSEIQLPKSKTTSSLRVHFSSSPLNSSSSSSSSYNTYKDPNNYALRQR